MKGPRSTSESETDTMARARSSALRIGLLGPRPSGVARVIMSGHRETPGLKETT